jgi:tetratricopeptide (TPR) repeat protein
LLLEALLVYWRVSWYDDLAMLVDCAESAFPGIGESPVWAALRSDVLAATGDLRGAGVAARCAAAASVDGVVPSRWDEAELLRRAAERVEGEADTHGLVYLQGVWQAENGRVDDAVAAFQRGRKSSRTDVRPLSDKALADWYELVVGNRKDAVQCLRELLALCPGDRRALLQLDDCLHALHDVEERVALWQNAPMEVAARGDITFHIARCAFDSGRPEEAVQLLIGRRFSVYEGGTSVRRLYVDALLAAAMLHWRAGRAETARQRCRDVFDYPRNLGAASYLGEHSRLARFLLGLFADREGDEETARTWWEDVLARSTGDVAYVVGDVDAAARLRADERMAVVLASQRLGQAVSQRASVRTAPPSTPAGAIEALCAALPEDPRSAARMGRGALGRFPCDPVLRLLVALAETLANVC